MFLFLNDLFSSFVYVLLSVDFKLLKHIRTNSSVNKDSHFFIFYACDTFYTRDLFYACDILYD